MDWFNNQKKNKNNCDAGARQFDNAITKEEEHCKSNRGFKARTRCTSPTRERNPEKAGSSGAASAIGGREGSDAKSAVIATVVRSATAATEFVARTTPSAWTATPDTATATRVGAGHSPDAPATPKYSFQPSPREFATATSDVGWDEHPAAAAAAAAGVSQSSTASANADTATQGRRSQYPTAARRLVTTTTRSKRSTANCTCTTTTANKYIYELCPTAEAAAATSVESKTSTAATTATATRKQAESTSV